jgi:hypothetical protein
MYNAPSPWRLSRGPHRAVRTRESQTRERRAASASPFSPDRGEHFGNRPIAVKLSAVSDPVPAAVKLGLGSTWAEARCHANDQNRRNLAVHQAVDEGRVAALLRTSIIAACKAYALASCLRASWMEARAGTRNPLLGQAVSCSLHRQALGHPRLRQRCRRAGRANGPSGSSFPTG